MGPIGNAKLTTTDISDETLVQANVEPENTTVLRKGNGTFRLARSKEMTQEIVRDWCTPAMFQYLKVETATCCSQCSIV